MAGSGRPEKAKAAHRARGKVLFNPAAPRDAAD
jgi:hypothetical protein